MPVERTADLRHPLRVLMSPESSPASAAAAAGPVSPAPRRRPALPEPEIVPDKLIHRPATWFERFSMDTLFPRSAPLEVELGSGDGSFLLDWAEAHPERNFLGVERLLGRIRKIDRKAQRRRLTNVLGLRIEASYCLEYLLPPGSVSRLHVYFPDPWPKRKHWKNRLVNERFPELAAAVVEPGGEVWLRTDHGPYFEQMLKVFGACPRFLPVPTPPDLLGCITDFERGFQARGVPTCHAGYRRVADA